MSLSRRGFLKATGTAAVGLAASRAVSPHHASAQDGDRPLLRMAINSSDLGTLDPHYASGTQDRASVAMMFNGLVRFKPGDSSQFEPDLAEEMPTATENADGTQSWTFKLRKGVMIHATDGVESAELTADDVLFSYEKASNTDTSGYAGDYAGWKFEAPDASTFVITLPMPWSETLFLPKVADYSGGYIVPKAPYEKIGAEGFVTNPVGTGPFAFESHTPQNNITLVAHDDYFRGAPKLAGVEMRYIADNTSRELALQSNDVQVIYGLLEAAWVERMNTVEGIKADVFGVGEVIFINFDVEHEILKDAKVREAIVKAIDRNNHLSLFGEPVGMPIHSIVPADLMPGGLTEEEATEAGVAYAQDIEGAKTLLSDAGLGEGFELDLITSEMDDYKMNYEVLGEELRQIGVTVNIEVVQHAAMHEMIREGRNPITIYIAFRPTADTYLTQFFSTDGGVTNFSKFKVDDLRDQARAEIDADKQAELWKQANIEIGKAYAGYGLLYKNLVWARTDKVDYGHELKSVVQLYPGINETTTLAQ